MSSAVCQDRCRTALSPSGICLKNCAEKRYIMSGGQRQNRAHARDRSAFVRQTQEKVSGLSFVGQVAEQEQIKTDWLSADWHEKKRPREGAGGTSSPKPTERLSKSEKQQVRAAAKWILQRVSLLDWGRKMPDADAGKPVPKPVNLKEPVLAHLRRNWRSGVRKLTLTAIIRHLLDDDTAYFTANTLGDETLLCVDIDCHASGTLEGATQFAEFLKRNYFPDLYIETSTHGNGAHGFLVVDKSFWSDAEYKVVLGKLEEWLKRVLRSTDFDVEDVELKGTPMTVQWGARRGEVRGVTFGFLAKMPRDWRRFDEWKATTRMTAHELRASAGTVRRGGSRGAGARGEVACTEGRQGVGLGEAGRSRGRPQAGDVRQGAAGVECACGRGSFEGEGGRRGPANGACPGPCLHAAPEP